MRNAARSLLVAAMMLAGLAACSPDTVVVGGERAGSQGDADDSSAASSGDTATGESNSDTADTESDDDTAVTESDDAADVDDDDAEADADNEDPASAAELQQSEGFGLGSEEQVASLLSDCSDGSDLACDVLFQISAFDSDEETAAVTCGGRSDVEVLFCTDDIDALDGELAFDPDSPGLDEIVDRCEISGDMTACDFLYYRSPLDSAFEEIGATCGGRVTVAVPDCRTFLTESG